MNERMIGAPGIRASTDLESVAEANLEAEKPSGLKTRATAFAQSVTGCCSPSGQRRGHFSMREGFPGQATTRGKCGAR